MAVRKTLREKMLENHKALNAQLRMRGLPEKELSPLCPPEPKRRGPAAPRTSESLKSEGEVQREVITFLEQHPRVALVVRINNGTMERTGQDGRTYPIWFNRIHKRGKHGLRIVDLDITMLTGKRFVLEVKREGWKFNPNILREVEQKNYIDFQIALGNLGGFATCVEDVLQLLGES